VSTRSLLTRPVRRRDFLKLGAGVALGASLPFDAGLGRALTTAAAAGSLRLPSSRPFPDRPAGVPQPDLAPELANIDHIIMVMMENHSFDNYFGMLPWHVASRAGQIDGWPAIEADGRPTTTQTDPSGNTYRAFPLPDACQPRGVSQSWDSSHLAYNGGRLDGFLQQSSEEAVGYWDEALLPFYSSLGATFPVCDRYFSSTLCQTYPNRVFMMAATAAGLISTDTPPPMVQPPNGHIFQVLDAHNVSWADYYTNLPTPGLFYPSIVTSDASHFIGPHAVPNLTAADFQAVCQANLLPSVVMVESDYEFASEENPQDIQAGQYFVDLVVQALMGSPAWSSSLLIFTYDEHGGYYDHVPPPAALSPGDGTHPQVHAGQSTYGDDYTLYGFRVPTVIVSPFAKSNFVSHTVYDHTSWLATIQRKWNLPALTFRDANANHLGDCLVSSGAPPFATPPALAAAQVVLPESSYAQCQTESGSNFPGPEAPANVPEGGAALIGAAGVAAASSAAWLRRRNTKD
jgi:phospholipase C